MRILQVLFFLTTTVSVSAQTPIQSPLTYESLLPAFNRLTSDSNRCIALIEYDGYDNLSIGKPDRLLFNGGYCSFTNENLSSDVFHYYDCDHQGNIRAVVNENGTKEQITHYYPFGGIIADISTNQTLQPYKYNGKELDRMHGLDTYDYGARQYNPILPMWDRMDPLCEKYYNINPYVYCLNNPANAIDPDGRKVVADSCSIDNIYSIVRNEDYDYISFDSNGNLNNNLILKYKGNSTIINVLKALSNSDLCYIFESSLFSDDGKSFYESDSNFRYGVTEFPDAENSPSPDDDIHIIVGSNLSKAQQCMTTAHEGMGHAYIYEKTRNWYEASHHFSNKLRNVSVNNVIIDYELVRYDYNVLLDKQIKTVVKEAKLNYKNKIKIK